MAATRLAIRPLTVGPIVGHTTATSVRLWGRGEDVRRGEAFKRCFGIAQLLDAKGAILNTRWFPMRPGFDFTGVVEFEGLTPGTAYQYRIGFTFNEKEPDELPDDVAATSLKPLTVYGFRTMPAENDKRTSFVFGSCSYLLRLFGGFFFDDRGDKTFRSIRDQAEGLRTDFTLMLGDQIYADDMNAVFPDDTASAFHARYQKSFSREHFSSLVSKVPTYMVLDDHEIEDNWSQDRATSKHTLYTLAMHAYASYQQVHGPSFAPTNDETLSDAPKVRWYEFSAGLADVFVMDVRTERFTKHEMISPRQMETLKRWLASPRRVHKYKFVGSSVPMFPDLKTFSDDKWSGFPAQRAELLRFIDDQRLTNVVFLSGDVHCSSSSTVTGPNGTRIHSLVSSPFFWPYPAETEHHFVREGDLPGAPGFVLGEAFGFVNEDNFCRVNADSLDELTFEIYGRKGRLLASTRIKMK